MAKSALARHHNKRLYKKAIRELKACSPYRLDKLSYGRVFKQDVWDCGIPKCRACHHYRTFEKKKFRLESRSLEKQLRSEI